MTRKMLAGVILISAIGLYVESENPYGVWQRAPLTGALIVGTVATLRWAVEQFSDTEEIT